MPPVRLSFFSSHSLHRRCSVSCKVRSQDWRQPGGRVVNQGQERCPVVAAAEASNEGSKAGRWSSKISLPPSASPSFPPKYITTLFYLTLSVTSTSNVAKTIPFIAFHHCYASPDRTVGSSSLPSYRADSSLML